MYLGRLLSITDSRISALACTSGTSRAAMMRAIFKIVAAAEDMGVISPVASTSSFRKPIFLPLQHNFTVPALARSHLWLLHVVLMHLTF